MFFKKSKQEADILPPPPPFPKLDLEELPPIKEEVKFKPKIKKKQKSGMDAELEQLEKELLKIPRSVEGKTKKSLFKISAKKTPEEKETRQMAKDEKKKRKEIERQKIIEEKRQRKIEKERLKQEKEILKKQKKEEKIKKEPFEIKEEQIPELAIKTEKPPEIFQAELEIEKAIKELRKKPKFKLFKPKAKLTKRKIKLPEIPGEELPPLPELPKPKIEEPKDEVTAIKHKIHDTRNALMDFDLLKAKTVYIKMMRMYNNLSPEKQAIVYEQIKDLYEERKNAESLKIKS